MTQIWIKRENGAPAAAFKTALLAVALLAMLIVGAACAPTAQPQAQTKKTVVVAIQPSEAVADMTAKAEDLKAYLEKETGLQMKVFVPTSHAAVVEALKFGNADVALMGALPALWANVRAEADVSLAEVREVADDQGKSLEATYYYSHFIALKDSPISAIEQLKGKKVALASPLSTSGFLFPVAELVNKGLVSRATPGQSIAPDDLRKKLETEFFKEATFAGGYAQAWEALKRGQVDAAVIAGDVSKKLYDEVLAGSKILTKQGPVPSHTVVMRKGLDPAIRSKVENALLKMDQPEQKEMMRKFLSAIFVRFQKTTTQEHFKGLMQAVDLTGYEIVQK